MRFDDGSTIKKALDHTLIAAAVLVALARFRATPGHGILKALGIADFVARV